MSDRVIETFKVGDAVTWSSSSGGFHGKVKQGVIVAEVPPNHAPASCMPEGYRCGYPNGFGMGRDHTSYLVKVKGRGKGLYWPRAWWLRKDLGVKIAEGEARQTARIVSAFMNNMGCDLDALVRELSIEHRTIQQVITNFCSKWLQECAKKHQEGDFDLRNQASCELGKAFVGRTTPQERALPFL